MMQSIACPFPIKEEPQIKEEIIDVESTDYCFTHSSGDVDGGEVVTGNTLHEQCRASISTPRKDIHFRAWAPVSQTPQTYSTGYPYQPIVLMPIPMQFVSQVVETVAYLSRLPYNSNNIFLNGQSNNPHEEPTSSTESSPRLPKIIKPIPIKPKPIAAPAITNTVTSTGAVFSLHNSANTLPKPIVSLIPVTPITPFTPAAHVTPATAVTPAAHVTPVTPAVPVTPATEVPNNTGFQVRVMTKGKIKHDKAPVPPAKEYGNDVNTTEGLKFTAHPEKELPKSKPAVADVYITPEHDDILEAYFQKRPYISLAEANNIYKKHGIPRNVTKAWFQVKRARRRGATSASGRIVICTKGQGVTSE